MAWTSHLVEPALSGVVGRTSPSGRLGLAYLVDDPDETKLTMTAGPHADGTSSQ